MATLIGFILLALATGTAQSLGRAHRPVALAFWWMIITIVAQLLRVPDVIIYVSMATSPIAIVAASWTALQSRARPYLGILFVSLGSMSTLIGIVADRTHTFGAAMACISLSSALAGAAAFYRSDAPPVTRSVLSFLVAGLPCEALGWIAWGGGFDAGYDYARMVSRITLAVIVFIQVTEGLAWRPSWARLQGGHLAHVRQWASTWRRAELDDERKKDNPRG